MTSTQASSPLRPGDDVAGLFRARYLEMVRLAGLLGADDPEDIAQEAFARLMRKGALDAEPAPYLRAIVCNLTRNRHRHLRVVRQKTPRAMLAGPPLAGSEPSSEQVAILREDRAEVIAALAKLPARRREAIVLRFWLDLSEREIARTMGVSPGTVKSSVSRGMAALALDAHAETFTASQDAWQRVERKSELRARPRRVAGTGWMARHSGFVIPAAAAAVVAALALGATGLAHEFSAGGGSPHATASHPASNNVRPLPANGLLDRYPATSPIVSDTVTRTITVWYWMGLPSPHYWFPYPASGPQFCSWLGYSGGGSGSCWPLPTVNAAHPAVVISNNDYSPANPVITGLAEPAVTSVTAVLRDGQRRNAILDTIPVSGRKAWSVNSAAEQVTKLIVGGAAGQVITTLSAAAPVGPVVLDIPRPSHGGVPMFSYPASQLTFKAGSVTAYLIDGHVAFFSTAFFRGSGAFSPVAASGRPAVDGMASGFGYACTPGCRLTNIKAFGYAHGDVAKVVVRLPGGGQVAADTFPAGWPGSDLRLWQVTLPDSVWPGDGFLPKLIAVAYDAAGHQLGQTQLGQPQN